MISSEQPNSMHWAKKLHFRPRVRDLLARHFPNFKRLIASSPRTLLALPGSGPRTCAKVTAFMLKSGHWSQHKCRKFLALNGKPDSKHANYPADIPETFKKKEIFSGIVVPGVVGEPHYPHSDSQYGLSRIRKFAAERRRSPTPAERELNRFLESLNGAVLKNRYSREYVVSGKWIIDFYFPEVRLAIEVDGSFHWTEQQMRKDWIKQEEIEALDITLLRLTNKEVAGNKSVLRAKLREAWRQALQRPNKIVGMSWEEYLGRG